MWTLTAVAQRRGQSTFRNQLLEAYDLRCAITGSNAVAVLEAAHICPYRGDHTNRVDNGLLLRADIHTLFDLGLIWVTPEHHITVAPS
ncbi:HNH endonuclease, partial [Solirubrobacter sp. CPCC 204708]|nr:HNH endonuclease [Solirubrobacter deserti]